MLPRMVLLQIENADGLVAPVVIAALDGWVDAGGAATTAAGHAAAGGTRVATFDDDRLYDYRARRPILDIVDGRPATLAWPELLVRRAKIGERDVLVFTGPEPDFHWRELAGAPWSLPDAWASPNGSASGPSRRPCHTPAASRSWGPSLRRASSGRT